jgi:hypothetical protein
MRLLSKYVTAAALTGALALAAATPSQARWYGHGWHNGAGAAVGFGAGALVGAAAANAAYPGYYDYGYAPGYAYAPRSAGAYAYEPAPGYRSDGAPACAGDLGYGRPDYSSC